MILILTLSIIVILIVISWIGMVRDSKRINVKGPFPLPILGNAHLLITKSTDIIDVLKDLSLKYGDAFRLHFLSRPVVTLSHPKYIEPLLLSMEHLTKGMTYDFMVPYVGQSLLISKGQQWQNQRKLLTPAFHYNVLQNILPIICKNKNMLTEKLKSFADGKSFDVTPLVTLTALDSVIESIMGTSLQEHEKLLYLKALENVSIIIALRRRIPFLGNDTIFKLVPYKRIHDESIKYLHEFAMKVIKARREELKNRGITTLNENSDIGLRNKHAFLDLLLLTEINGRPIDDVTVRQEVDTFMAGGFDSTSICMACSLYCLAKRRDVQEKIIEEQKQILGDDIHRDPTYSELQQMKYLEKVINESMRLYSPVPFIERSITKDCEVGELKLIRGTSVIVNIFQAQRNPDVFKDPLEFRPERFDSPLKTPSLAFSTGPRNCIAQKFAMMQLKANVLEVVKKFIILPADEEPKLYAALFLKSKNGVHIKLLRRT